MSPGKDTSEDYRELERAARSEAEQTSDPEARQHLLGFAALWAAMAEQEEAGAEAPEPGKP